MTRRTRWMLPCLLVLALLVAACGGQSQPAPPVPDERATVAAVEEEEVLDLSEAKTIDEVADINSFSLGVTLSTEGAAFEQSADSLGVGGEVSIRADIVKEPPAQHLTMRLGEEGGLFGNIEFILVGDEAFGKIGDQWAPMSADAAPTLDDLTVIRVQDISDDVNQMERVGSETINGRETLHLRADKATLQSLDLKDDELGIAAADMAELNLWIDRDEGFIVKMDLLVSGYGVNQDVPDAEGRLQMTLVYDNFNADFDIQPPP